MCGTRSPCDCLKMTLPLRREERTAMANITNISQDVAAALNLVVFAGLLGVKPDPWQEDVLRSDSKRIILNCARQSGKSTVTAIWALHHALYNSDALVLIVSPSLRQSSEMFNKVIRFYHDLGKPVPADKETALCCSLRTNHVS